MYKRILLSLVVIGGLSQASAVTISSNKVESYAKRVGILDNEVSDTFDGTSIPASVTLNASFASGVVSSETTVEYAGSGDQVTFSNTFKHENIADHEEESGSLGNMSFTVDSDVSYELTGRYKFDSERTEEEIYLWFYFHDVTTPSLLVEIGQSSTTMTPLELSFSGTLLAGHSYSFNFRAETEEKGYDTDAFTVVSSSGDITLKIGGGAPEEGNGDPDDGNGNPDDRAVPDTGATAALMGLSLLGLAAARRRLVD